MLHSGRYQPQRGVRPLASAPPGRPGARSPLPMARSGRGQDENAALHAYERRIKDAFDAIVPTLKQLSVLQHGPEFEARAQRLAQERLGFDLPQQILADAWLDRLDMRRLFAWCVFSSYHRFCDDYYLNAPLAVQGAAGFDAFLQECGFHTLDISPCADGRLAHLVRYVLRLPQQAVRRKSYAGALFDIEDSIQKWTEVELRRFREGQPNEADAPTRYLKLLSYHFSSVDPERQGCAAHGSDTQKAAQAGLERLLAFREAIENSFCCGASIDLLLIGLDTDTDAIRVHLPDAQGELDLQRWLDVAELERCGGSSGEAIRAISSDLDEGMARLIERLIDNNRRQIAYVRQYHGGHYQDIGHAERFIGAGVGFEEIQLRNLMYFAYMDTVEEAAADLDVGMAIFTRLNVERGLPVPVILRFDHHSRVPGSRQRAVQHCARVAQALQTRYAELHRRGLLHLLQVTRDCDAPGSIEVLDCSLLNHSVLAQPQAGDH